MTTPHCPCGRCEKRRQRGHDPRPFLSMVPRWGHYVLARLDHLERIMATDFSALQDAINDDKVVDDLVLAKLEELTTALAQAASSGDPAKVAELAVELQQHTAAVRAALAGTDTPSEPPADTTPSDGTAVPVDDESP